VAIDRLVERFLAGGGSERAGRRQLVSLGAGSDTRFFRLVARDEVPDVVYHELDFAANTTAKVARIRGSPRLRLCFGDGELDGPSQSELHTPNYHLHALDLRTLDGGASPVLLPGLDLLLPTLLISECCLVYLPAASADAVVQYFTTVFPTSTPLGLVLYEPINPFDAFGKVMVANLAARGIVLQTLHKYGSLDGQRARLRGHGFVAGQAAADVRFLWERWVEEKEKGRVSGLEMMDEVEEFELLARHYCVAWGCRGEAAWEGWSTLVRQDEGD
jgi:[phosphatase 2A protein]-leucine-carboxy methyltransferase